jgi:hypothetical protein
MKSKIMILGTETLPLIQLLSEIDTRIVTTWTIFYIIDNDTTMEMLSIKVLENICSRYFLIFQSGNFSSR